jgi:hypothetical protein
VCGKELRRKNFYKHQHEAPDCKFCGEKLLNPANLQKHIASKHKGEKEPKIDVDEKRKQEIENYLRDRQMLEAKLEKSQVRAVNFQNKQNFQCDVNNLKKISIPNLT